MPLTTYDPRTQSLAGKLPVRTGDFAESAFAQGVNDTLLGWATRQSENFAFGDTGDELSPDELKSRYGLTFAQPMREGRAQLLAARKQADDDRAFVLGNGMTGFGRFSLMMGAGMAGSLANPVDFAANIFIPFVGEAAIPARAGLETAEAATLIGKTAARAKQFATGGGLITTTELRAAGLPSGPVMASIFEGAMANAAIEIPLAYEKIVQEHNANYGIGDSALNVVAGGVLAGGIRAAGKAVGAALSRLSSSTHEAAFREALNAAAMGRDIDSARIINMSDEQIRAAVMERATQRAEAEVAAMNALARGGAPADKVGTEALVDILRRRAQATVDTTEQRVVRRLFQRAVDGETDASFYRQAAEFLGLAYDPSETRMPARFAEGAASPSTRTGDFVRAKETLEFSEAEIRLEQLEARIGEIESAGNRASNAEYVERHNLQSRVAELKQAGYGVKELSFQDRSAHQSVVDAENARIAERERQLDADFTAEKQRRIQQYIDELLPTTPEARAKFVDRYEQQRAIELDETAKRAGVHSDEALKKMAAADTMEKVGAVVDEDIASLKQQLGMAEAKPKTTEELKAEFLKEKGLTEADIDKKAGSKLREEFKEWVKSQKQEAEAAKAGPDAKELAAFKDRNTKIANALKDQSFLNCLLR